MPKNIELSQAMSARICHDLSSSVGTIENCISLIANRSKVISEKAKTLVTDESKVLVNRVKLFRAAYGNGSADADESLISISKLIKDYLNSTDVIVNMHIEEGMLYVSSPIAKAAMTLSLIAATNINYVGTIDLYIRSDINHPVELTSDGINLDIKEEVKRVLMGDIKQPITVANCREHYLHKLCAKANSHLSVHKKAGFAKYDIYKNN